MFICFFVFDYNINHYNTLKMKKELFLFVFLSVFITLINLGTQTRYTIVNFGLNQLLHIYLSVPLLLFYTVIISAFFTSDIIFYNFLELHSKLSERRDS